MGQQALKVFRNAFTIEEIITTKQKVPERQK